jgi:hypothetical protein
VRDSKGISKYHIWNATKHHLYASDAGLVQSVKSGCDPRFLTEPMLGCPCGIRNWGNP